MLEIAAAQGRILVTHDFRTMPRHFENFLSAGRSSPGVFLVQQRTTIALIIDDLVLIWTASEPEDWANRIADSAAVIGAGGHAWQNVVEGLAAVPRRKL